MVECVEIKKCYIRCQLGSLWTFQCISFVFVFEATWIKLFISHSRHNSKPYKSKTRSHVSSVFLLASHALSLARMAIACGPDRDIFAIVNDEGSMYTKGYGQYDLTCGGGKLQVRQQSLFLDRDETFEGEGVVWWHSVVTTVLVSRKTALSGPGDLGFSDGWEFD